MNKKLRKLQLLEVEMLDEFVRICNKYSFKYYLGFGTLLGAVRHHGFIPWDDDLDVLIPREDFQLFCKVAQKELDSRYFFHSIKTDPHYPDSVVRIRKCGTIYADNITLQMRLKNYGCWVDIYPLDRVQNPKSLKFLLQGYAGIVAKGFAFYRAIQNCRGLSFQKRIKHYISMLLPLSIWSAIREALFQLDSNSKAKYIMPFAAIVNIHRWKHAVMPEDWYGEPVKVEFEGKQYNAPHKWDFFLRRIYGDYMSLPPPEQRVGHPPDIWEM